MLSRLRLRVRHSLTGIPSLRCHNGARTGATSESIPSTEWSAAPTRALASGLGDRGFGDGDDIVISGQCNGMLVGVAVGLRRVVRLLVRSEERRVGKECRSR